LVWLGLSVLAVAFQAEYEGSIPFTRSIPRFKDAIDNCAPDMYRRAC
jgi:hypothetical protein